MRDMNKEMTGRTEPQSPSVTSLRQLKTRKGFLSIWDSGSPPWQYKPETGEGGIREMMGVDTWVIIHKFSLRSYSPEGQEASLPEALILVQERVLVTGEGQPSE